MIGWLDCAAGASGDMLLGALVDAGVPLQVVQEAVGALGVPVRIRTEPVVRHGIGATRVLVELPESSAPRPWRDVRALLGSAGLDEAVRADALDAFARLARAESAVHRAPADEVHFHEVGALDALADVVGACAGMRWLREYRGLASLTVGTVSLGSGSARSAHGVVPVPAPAVLRILGEAGLPVQAGAADVELCTPTGAALLATFAAGHGRLPELTVTATGHGAGNRDLVELPNLLRLVLGEPVGGAVVLEANIDDLDPRLWPTVLDELLGAGASDAWLSPITMKKGRPAHTLHVLCTVERAAALRRAVFTHTSTIGLRELSVGKHALDRWMSAVDVAGCPVRVKRSFLGGELMTTSVEYADVVAAADTLGLPVRTVLTRATAAAAQIPEKNVSDPVS